MAKLLLLFKDFISSVVGKINYLIHLLIRTSHTERKPIQCKIIAVHTVLHRHRGGRIQKINAWYLNTHMVYL